LFQGKCHRRTWAVVLAGCVASRSSSVAMLGADLQERSQVVSRSSSPDPHHHRSKWETELAISRAASPFQQHMNERVVEQHSVAIPRGASVAGSSAVPIPPASKYDAKLPLRTYPVVVEPGANRRKAKDVLRGEARPSSNVEFDAELTSARKNFGRERATHFQLGRHFPALVNPKVVPSWQLIAAGRGTVGHSGAEHSMASKLYDLTLSAKEKQQMERIVDQNASPWLISGASEARKVVCDRVPSLHENDYEGRRTADWKQIKEHKAMKEAISPRSRGVMRPAGRENREESERRRRIEEAKNRSSGGAVLLQDRYAARRECYLEERGRKAIMKLEQDEESKQLQAAEKAKHQPMLTAVEEEELQAAPKSMLAGMFSGAAMRRAPSMGDSRRSVTLATSNV